MRATTGVLMVLVCLAACETRYGTYLVVDGEPKAIEFDRVELFFGRGGAAEAIPKTPQSPSATGKRFARQFTAADQLTLDVPGREVEFYLPEDSERVGKYIAVVAFAGETPVGIGELVEYEIATGTIYQYVIALEPWSPDVEYWGDPSAPACLRWTRARGPGAGNDQTTTIAVVRGDDHDCDSAAMDCQDLEYCTADMPCSKQSGGICFTEDPACAVGRCVDGQGCVALTCTVPGVCDPACEAIPTLPERLTCAMDLAVAVSHIAVKVPVDPQSNSCIQSLVISFAPPTDNLDCSLPRIEWPPDGVFPDIKFKVLQVPVLPPGTPLPCQLQLDFPGVAFVGDHHVLLSIAATPTGNPTGELVERYSFVLGAEPGTVSPCAPGADAPVEGMGTVMTCTP